MIPSLAHLLGELAAAAPDVSGGTDGETHTWSRAGTAFAIEGPQGVELRLVDRAIVAAASRTPDVGPSSRGPEWVRVNPRKLDGHAVDRVTAWFELACRRAADTGG